MSNKHSYLAHFFTLTLITMFVGYSDVNAQVQLGRDTIIKIDYSNPLEYEIGGVTVSGLRFLDERALITISGLEVGSKIRVPGDRIAKAIESLWKQGILDDVKIVVTEIKGENIFLELQLAEKPQLTRYKFTGVTKSEADKLREKLGLKPGNIITEALKKTTSGIVKNYFVDKGFLKATCNITTALDSITRNGEIMFINISKSSKTKINKIYIEGNSELKDIKIKRKLKDTKERHWYRLFKTSKYIESNLEEDIEAVIAKYQERGLRDANLVSHSIKDYDAKSIDLTLTVYEGPKYYFRNITWIGNTKYRSGQLDTVLNIKKGDIYNQKQLDEALYMSQSGRDIQSLYMDDGYLFSALLR
ncbi:MAG: hypothetical protein IPO27_05020 [Bacteroidetes bacterium]|nr:hypothetical protein [Bacteroidota bacterium]